MSEDLIAFIRAQLDDDERVVRQLLAEPGGFYLEAETDDTNIMTIGAYVHRWNPKRVLAEIEAKRAVIDRYADMHYHAPAIPTATSPILRVEDTGACRTCVTMGLLAQPCAGQPGWREEWSQ